MKDKINIAELLKDCPKGMELDCALYDNVFFDGIDTNDDNFPISLYYKHNNIKNGFSVTKYGTYYNHQNTKCIIFPKGKTTWEGFVPPCQFKDGDIVFISDEYSDTTFTYVAIFEEMQGDEIFMYCAYNYEDNAFYTEDFSLDVYNTRFATEEEKQKLFKAIKDNGYKWNSETKTLDKLITPKKFDISSLKPFKSRVLIRDRDNDEWRGHFFSHYDNGSDRPYICIGQEGLSEYKFCIPYEGNEHLLGKTDSCDDFYKTW